MDFAIDQKHSRELPRRVESGANLLRRVRSSKLLASHADVKMSGGSSHTARTQNPTATLNANMLESHEQAQLQGRLHTAGSSSAATLAAWSSSLCPSLAPNKETGYAHESSESSLYAMIHGIFVGAGQTSVAQQSHHSTNHNHLQDENAFAFTVGPNDPSNRKPTMSVAQESRQEDGMNESLSGLSTSKTRSRGIPIQRSPPSQSSLEESISSEHSPDEACKETYDWATWRLYNRIIDHRNKYPVSACYMNAHHHGASGRSPQFSSHISDAMGLPFEDLRAQLLRHDMSAMDGEVFHLEM